MRRLVRVLRCLLLRVVIRKLGMTWRFNRVSMLFRRLALLLNCVRLRRLLNR